MTDKKILWLIMGIALMAIALGIGWLRFEHKQEELERNRQYEVSLVKALKNSYAGIEEIRITDPSYSDKPGAWSCNVEILFKDEQEISYRIGHSLKDHFNYSGSKTYKQADFLEGKKGNTNSSVIVLYSDKEKGSI